MRARRSPSSGGRFAQRFRLGGGTSLERRRARVRVALRRAIARWRRPRRRRVCHAAWLRIPDCVAGTARRRRSPKYSRLAVARLSLLVSAGADGGSTLGAGASARCDDGVRLDDRRRHRLGCRFVAASLARRFQLDSASNGCFRDLIVGRSRAGSGSARGSGVSGRSGSTSGSGSAAARFLHGGGLRQLKPPWAAAAASRRGGVAASRLDACRLRIGWIARRLEARQIDRLAPEIRLALDVGRDMPAVGSGVTGRRGRVSSSAMGGSAITLIGCPSSSLIGGSAAISRPGSTGRASVAVRSLSRDATDGAADRRSALLRRARRA